MQPTSSLLLLLLLGACGVLLVLVARRVNWALRVWSGVLATVLAMVAGMAVVNDNYGYYQSWSTLMSDLSGSSPNLSAASASYRFGPGAVEAGSVHSIDLPGALSGIDRRGLLYLPPQYNDPKYAHMRFPVIELFHGSPGDPTDWLYHLRITRAVDTMISRHLMGPVVIVMPQINAGQNYVDCVNAPRVAADTYLSTDVPAYVRAHYRVSRDPASWGLAGYSSGGYCAANLALRHRSQFGAAAVLDGYFRAQDGPAGPALGNDQAAIAANSPLAEAAALSPATQPMPAFWVAAGTGQSMDYVAARVFVATLGRVEQVPFIVEPHAGHDFYAWAAALPPAMAWMWQQLASPDLRRAFPIAGPPTSVRIHAYEPANRHPTAAPRSPSPQSLPAASAPRATVTVAVNIAPPTKSAPTRPTAPRSTPTATASR